MCCQWLHNVFFQCDLCFAGGMNINYLYCLYWQRQMNARVIRVRTVRCVMTSSTATPAHVLQATLDTTVRLVRSNCGTLDQLEASRGKRFHVYMISLTCTLVFSIQFNNFIPDSTEHAHIIHMKLGSMYCCSAYTKK